MLKIIVVLVGVFIVGSSIYAESSSEILQKWDASNKFKKDVMLHCIKVCSAKKTYTIDPSSPNSGLFKVKISKTPKKSQSDIQLGFIYKGEIEQGAKYKIKLFLRSNKAIKIDINAMLTKSPWTLLGKKSSLKVNLEANKKQKIVIEFIAAKNFKNIRVPCLYLGKVPDGTELSIKSVVFEKINE
jgi:hypothetical protein